MKTIHKILDVCIKKDLDFNHCSIGLVIYEHKKVSTIVGYVSNSSDTLDGDLEKLLEKLEGME